MIAMKNAANGATYTSAAKIARIAARNRRWFVADNAMATTARRGPSSPSPNAESTLNQRASVGSASVSQANKNPSENCQIEKPATTIMTTRRTPLATEATTVHGFSRRRRDRGLDQSERIWRIPIGRTDQAPDLVPLAVDEKRGRHAHRFQLAEQLARWIGVEGKMRGSGLGEEVLRLIGAAAIDIHRHHLEIIAAERGLKFVERGHLLPAGHAPGGPDVEQHHLASPVAQGFRPAFAVNEADLAKIERLWPREERRHGALVQSGKRALASLSSGRCRRPAFTLLYR